jgi:mannose-6-phosphate isomerase-like protein (cupin superfamily)
MHHEHLAFDRFFEVVAETADAQAAQMTLGPGESTGGPDNYHAEADQWLFVHEGERWVVVDGDRQTVTAGDLLRIDAGERHEVGAGEGSSLATLNVYVPPRGDR